MSASDPTATSVEAEALKPAPPEPADHADLDLADVADPVIREGPTDELATPPGSPSTAKISVSALSHVSSSASATTSAATARVSSKSKRKKAAPVVSMPASGGGSPGEGGGAPGENTGRWTAEEHRLFLQGLEMHGKGWKKIASLIKSRTVVQIRTHAQKYFQKLAKARQNGEEGEIAMEGRGCPSSDTAVSQNAVVPGGKRRRVSIGTKRKVIQSVVASAHRQGKKFGAVGPDGHPLPIAAPALAHFVLPVAPSHSGSHCVSSSITAQGTISGPALEDSLFRFLSPVPVAEPMVNEVARSAGANPITLPSENPTAAPSGLSGDVSPTGVTELSVYPSWTDAKDTPSWYSKGADVDALLDVGDTLDWLADTGDLHESYQPPAAVESTPCIPDIDRSSLEGDQVTSSLPPANSDPPEEPNNTDITVQALPTVDTNNVESVIPPLPSLFDGSTDDIAESMKKFPDAPDSPTAATMAKALSNASIDDHLQVFDSPMEEHDFVSTILDENNGSHGDLHALA